VLHCDALRPQRPLRRLAVRVSVGDVSTGALLAKSDLDRAVTAPNEGGVHYVMPVITEVRAACARRARASVCA
jgi:hypothetical protein